MSDFIVSARKYRPSDFASVVGQTSITRTLENAISNEQLAHAYLFCGPRGVGKTSCARIFAKAINQENAEDDRDFSFNIFELDAASNNKVDDIRQLIDQVRIQPQVGKYKVYIIDEVHMLSKAAFNAFLKTLEEPPKHAIFILATTEKHKILPTILSRCQIYDFNRITTEDIGKHLAFVAQEEGVIAEEEALYLIAQKADGALRDALSIFDQIVSFNGKEVTYKKVLENLNILDLDHFFSLMEKVKQNDRSAIFLSIERILASGFQLSHFSSGLAQHIRDLMVSKDELTVQLLEVSNTIKNKYIEQSASIEEKFLLNALHLLNEAEVRMKTSSNQRLLIELTLLKIANLFGKPAEKKSPEPIEIKEDPKSIVQTRSIKEENGANSAVVQEEQIDVSPEPAIQEDVDTDARAEADNAPEDQRAQPTTVKSEKAILEESLKNEGGLFNEKAREYELPSNEESDLGTTAPEKSIDEEIILKAQNEVKQETAPVRPKIIRSVTSISLDQSLNVAEETPQYVIDTETPREIRNTKPVSQKALEASWKNFAEKVKAKGKYNLFAGLTSQKPTIMDDQIHFVLENKVLLEALNSERTDLLFHLREELENDTLDFEHSITASESFIPESGPAEKFREMTEKNPVLKQLKDEMDLGIE